MHGSAGAVGQDFPAHASCQSISLKNTVLVYPGERVKVAMRFAPHTCMYMYHRHILGHEDMAMMRNYAIKVPMAGM